MRQAQENVPDGYKGISEHSGQPAKPEVPVDRLCFWHSARTQPSSYENLGGTLLLVLARQHPDSLATSTKKYVKQTQPLIPAMYWL
jgi:hypothetical protein